jgi:hypothetical protein
LTRSSKSALLIAAMMSLSTIMLRYLPGLYGTETRTTKVRICSLFMSPIYADTTLTGSIEATLVLNEHELEPKRRTDEIGPIHSMHAEPISEVEALQRRVKSAEERALDLEVQLDRSTSAIDERLQEEKDRSARASREAQALLDGIQADCERRLAEAEATVARERLDTDAARRDLVRLAASVASDIARALASAHKADKELKRDLARAEDCARRSSADATSAQADARNARQELEERAALADEEAVHFYKELRELKERAAWWEQLGRRAVARVIQMDL